MKNSYFNYALILIASLYSFIDGIIYIYIGNIYSSLIRFSVIIVILFPWIIEKIFKIKLSNNIKTLYVIFIFLSHFLGSVVNFYHKINHYDKFIHFLSGVMAGYLALYLLKSLKSYNNKELFYNFLFIISFTMLTAFSWELFEFTCDNLFNKDAQNVIDTGVSDTMFDMLSALIGSIIVGIIYIIKNKFKTKLNKIT